jgi:hypothetical protein
MDYNILQMNSRAIDSNYDILMQFCFLNSEQNIPISPIDNQKRELFKKFFKTYSEYLLHKNRAQGIIEALHLIIKPLTIDMKSCVLNFLWGLSGFKKSLADFSDILDGDSRSSIFGVIIGINPLEYVKNDTSSQLFERLGESMCRKEFDSVFSYLMRFVKANKEYTYDNVILFRNKLDSFELLGTVLILLFRLIRNNIEYVFDCNTMESGDLLPHNINIIESKQKDIWEVINTLYFTLFDINESTIASLKFNKNEYLRMDEEYQRSKDSLILDSIKRTDMAVKDGKNALSRLMDIVGLIDHIFMENIIFNNTDYVLRIGDMGIVSRIRIYILNRGREFKPGTDRANKMCKFVDQVLQSNTPAQLKSEFLRYIMSYSLTADYVKIMNLDSLIKYLFTDARKLEDIKLIHSLDVLEHFGEHLYRSNSADVINHPRNVRVILLYLGYIDECTEIYEKIVKSFIMAPYYVKPDIIADVVNIIGYAKSLITMIGLIGNEALSYIDPLFKLLDKIVDTKNILNGEDMGRGGMNDPSVSSVIDRIKPSCIENCTPLIIEMFKSLNDRAIFFGNDYLNQSNQSNQLNQLNQTISDEWLQIYGMYYVQTNIQTSDSVFRLCLKPHTVQIMRDIFKIDLDNHNISYLIIDSQCDALIENEPDIAMRDALTFEMVLAPVMIPTSSVGNAGTAGTAGTDDTVDAVDNVVLVDQRTMHKILLDNQNPYTRQPMNYQDIVELNSRPGIRANLDKVMDFIKRL